VLVVAVCKEGIAHYYEGDMWNVSSCEFCICRNGQKSCSFAQCEKIKCSQVNSEQLVISVLVNTYPYMGRVGVSYILVIITVTMH